MLAITAAIVRQQGTDLVRNEGTDKEHTVTVAQVEEAIREGWLKATKSAPTSARIARSLGISNEQASEQLMAAALKKAQEDPKSQDHKLFTRWTNAESKTTQAAPQATVVDSSNGETVSFGSQILARLQEAKALKEAGAMTAAEFNKVKAQARKDAKAHFGL